jgi:thioredoxin-related protein
MRRLLGSLVLVMGLMIYGATLPKAGRLPETIDTSRQGLRGEIVVFEVDNCIYCPVFRRDVLPAFRQSPAATRLPIRFIDINDVAVKNLGLDGPLRMVPTVVVFHGNREVGRIDGYTGAQHFMAFVNSHLPTDY